MTQQLQDAPELLEQMAQDQINAAPIYQTSSCWQEEATILTNTLRKFGLNNLRSKIDWLALQGFGATDPSPMYYPAQVLHNTPNMPPEYSSALYKTLDMFQQDPSYPGLPFGISVLDLCESAFRIADMYGKLNGASPLENIEISMIASPAFAFSINGKNYSEMFLRYYMRYAYCCQHIDFSKVDAVVEIGCGAGKFAEVLKKAHPHLTFYLLEIAPQSYISHQYLKGIFGDDAVVPYSDLRNNKEINIPKGKFAVLGNWQIEHIKPQGRVLFVNTASFQEMEPDIVNNYINHVKPFSHAMYLLQSITGVHTTQGSQIGATEPVVMAHYQKFLEDQFTLISQEIAYDPLKAIKDLTNNYHNMMWVNQKTCEMLRH